jgi:thioredoxin 1
MNITGRLLIVLALAAAVTGVVLLKQRGSEKTQTDLNENTRQKPDQEADNSVKIDPEPNQEADKSVKIDPEPNQEANNSANYDPVQIKSIEAKALPRLVDLGADKCIPCKMMAPILKELKTEYSGRMDVEFIDVWKNPDAGKKYGIKLIPTQIFYDASGKELFRNIGFLSKEDILSKWKELGYSFE